MEQTAKVIFIIRYENGKISAGNREEIESDLTHVEEAGDVLEWRIIGKILQTNPMNYDKIDWYGYTPKIDIVNAAIKAISEYIKYGK